VRSSRETDSARSAVICINCACVHFPLERKMQLYGNKPLDYSVELKIFVVTKCLVLDFLFFYKFRIFFYKFCNYTSRMFLTVLRGTCFMLMSYGFCSCCRCLTLILISGASLPFPIWYLVICRQQLC